VQVALAHTAEAALMSGGTSKRPIASKVRARMVMSSPTIHTNPVSGKSVMAEIGTVNEDSGQKRRPCVKKALQIDN